eukprot:GILK01012705.1.p1 GENE.GILK01012705.1~~GILK01012705.1.p1  ORF type:complete len:196 (-),score=18.52 GILK01012705.1:281-835(-)
MESKLAEEEDCTVCETKTKKASKAVFAMLRRGRPSVAASSAASQATANQHEPRTLPHEACPPDREELGKSTWTFLHTMAAYFPERPSDSEKDRARTFMTAFPYLYPCKHCAKEFQQTVNENPPEVNSRKDLSLWMCKVHNLVNRQLGMREYPCVLEDLDRRWRKGGPECYEQAQEAQDSLGQSN